MYRPRGIRANSGSRRPGAGSSRRSGSWKCVPPCRHGRLTRGPADPTTRGRCRRRHPPRQGEGCGHVEGLPQRREDSSVRSEQGMHRLECQAHPVVACNGDEIAKPICHPLTGSDDVLVPGGQPTDDHDEFAGPDGCGLLESLVFSAMAPGRESASVPVRNPPRHTVDALSPASEMIRAASSLPTPWIRSRQGPIHPGRFGTCGGALCQGRVLGRRSVEGQPREVTHRWSTTISGT